VNRRKIAVLTGKRGGYGAMKPMFTEIECAPDLELQLVATDQHLNKKFGKTISEIEKDFRVSASVDMGQGDDTYTSRAEALAKCASEMVSVFKELKPDICVLYGDRGEVFATAMTACAMNIPIAHIQGGDISGSVDDVMRHAVSKLSHIHFTSTKDAATRLAKMGEEEWRINIVGDSHLDPILAGDMCSRDEVIKLLSLDPSRRTLIILQHSETTEPELSYSQMEETLSAVHKFDENIIIVHPCSDVGYEGILSAINKYREIPNYHIHVNIEAPVFHGLMAMADCIIGNSSAGIIESQYFGIPAVNVGRRQIGRICSANVIHASHNVKKIYEAIERTRTEEFRDVAKNCERLYGDGTTGKSIVSKLRSVELGKNLLQKRMTY